MPPNQGSGSKGGRHEFEIAYYTKELGPELQRRLLRQRLADFSDSRVPGATPDGGDPAATPAADENPPPPAPSGS